MEGHRGDVRPDGPTPHQGLSRRGAGRTVERLPFIPLGRSVAHYLSRCGGQDVVPSRVNHRSRPSETLLKDYRPAKKPATVTVRESGRILRELQDINRH